MADSELDSVISQVCVLQETLDRLNEEKVRLQAKELLVRTNIHDVAPDLIKYGEQYGVKIIGRYEPNIRVIDLTHPKDQLIKALLAVVYGFYSEWIFNPQDIDIEFPSGTSYTIDSFFDSFFSSLEIHDTSSYKYHGFNSLLEAITFMVEQEQKKQKYIRF